MKFLLWIFVGAWIGAALPASEITSDVKLVNRRFADVDVAAASIQATKTLSPITVLNFAASQTKSSSPSSATCTQTVTPDQNGHVPPDSCGALWDYYPSFAAAVIMSVAFGLLTIAHIIQAAVWKKGFCWVVIMGALWEFGGFLIRALATKHQQSLALVIVSQLLILLAPLWINAFDYMVLARMIHFFSPEKRVWFFKPSVLAATFVTLDIFSFVIQGLGGSMASPGGDASNMMLGVHIYMGGIGLQEFFILMFTSITIRFHIQMVRIEQSGSLDVGKRHWRRMVYTLYASLMCITIRIIYRLIEFSSGTDDSNPMVTHEVYPYVLDALPMLFAIVVWNICHPGAVLQGPDSIMPSGRLRRMLCCCCHGRKKRAKATEALGTNDSSNVVLNPPPSHNAYNLQKYPREIK